VFEEIPSATATTAYIPPIHPLDMDIRLNVPLKADEELLMGLQFSSDVSAAMALSNASLYARILVESP